MLLEIRWKAKTASSQFQNVVSLLRNGGAITSNFSPFPQLEDDRSDFRGIDLEGLRIVNLKAHAADFSFANFCHARIMQSSFVDSRFLKTDFSNYSEHGNVFNNCSFVKCNFNGSYFGYDGSQYTNCKFENCTFAKTIFNRAEFNYCVFEKCKINNIDFHASSFENCEFIGVLNSAWFRGGYRIPSLSVDFGVARKNRMKSVSFEHAVLNDATFSNDCDLSTIIIPSTGDYKLFYNWRNKLEQVRVISETFPEEMKNQINSFVDLYTSDTPIQDYWLINFEDIGKWWKPPFSDKIIEILKAL